MVAKRIQPASVLDPVCGYGLLLAGAAEASGAETVHGVENNADVAGVASIVLGEQATLFFLDPSGNALEFKSFKDPSALFAT